MNEIDRLQQLAGIVNEDGEPGVDYKSDTGEGETKKLAVGHIDNERGMISKELYLIGKNTGHLGQSALLKEVDIEEMAQLSQSQA